MLSISKQASLLVDLSAEAPSLGAQSSMLTDLPAEAQRRRESPLWGRR